MVTGVVLVTALIVGFLWWAFQITDRDVRWRTLAFDVESASRVTVIFEVSSAPGERIRCVVRAAAADVADVGQAEVDVEIPPQGSAVRTISLRTLDRAALAEVRTCEPVPAGLS
jgi:hypothetical protein